tara:strand:- start:8592 stop:9353 length:762 start_codon:yes stop_codon:yes gene_type:complete
MDDAQIVEIIEGYIPVADHVIGYMTHKCTRKHSSIRSAGYLGLTRAVNHEMFQKIPDDEKEKYVRSRVKWAIVHFLRDDHQIRVPHVTASELIFTGGMPVMASKDNDTFTQGQETNYNADYTGVKGLVHARTLHPTNTLDAYIEDLELDPIYVAIIYYKIMGLTVSEICEKIELSRPTVIKRIDELKVVLAEKGIKPISRLQDTLAKRVDASATQVCKDCKQTKPMSDYYYVGSKRCYMRFCRACYKLRYKKK